MKPAACKGRGKIVLTKSGKLGRTIDGNLVQGKVVVYLYDCTGEPEPNCNFKLTPTGDVEQIITAPENLTIKGFID